MNFLSYREKEIKNIMFKTMVLINYSCDPTISFVQDLSLIHLRAWTPNFVETDKLLLLLRLSFQFGSLSFGNLQFN